MRGGWQAGGPRFSSSRPWEACTRPLLPTLLLPPLPALPLQPPLAEPDFTRPRTNRAARTRTVVLRPGLWGQPPSGSGRPPACSCPDLPALPPESQATVSAVVLSAGPRACLLSQVPLTTLLSTVDPRPPFPSPSVCSPSSGAFLPCAARPSLCLGAPTASRLRGPLLSSPLARSPAQPPRRRHGFRGIRTSSLGWRGRGTSKGLVPTLLMSTLAQKPLGN